MKNVLPIALLSTLLLAGCGGMRCQDPGYYQAAQPGKRIEMLDGMDPLPTAQEMTIPQASPDAPPPPGECIDAPPTLRTGGSDNESSGSDNGDDED